MPAESVDCAAEAGPLASAVVAITIGVDGRVYCHDITPELLPILTELCGGDPQITVRQRAAQALELPDVKGRECQE